MTEIVEISRLAFLGKGEFSFTSFSYSIIITFVALIIGTLIFNKVEKTFIDKV
jgi:lipopolysaccharide transport system permease protein